jgi:hypothetical protein
VVTGHEAGVVRNLPAIHVPIILLAVVLHLRNRRAAGRCPGPPWPGRGRLPLPLRTPNR